MSMCDLVVQAGNSHEHRWQNGHLSLCWIPGAGEAVWGGWPRQGMGAQEKLHLALRYTQTPIYLQKPTTQYTQALMKGILLQELHLHIQWLEHNQVTWLQQKSVESLPLARWFSFPACFCHSLNLDSTVFKPALSDLTRNLMFHAQFSLTTPYLLSYWHSHGYGAVPWPEVKALSGDWSLTSSDWNQGLESPQIGAMRLAIPHPKTPSFIEVYNYSFRSFPVSYVESLLKVTNYTLLKTRGP